MRNSASPWGPSVTAICQASVSGRAQGGGHRGGVGRGAGGLAEGEAVAGPQRPPLVPAEAPEGEGRARAEELGHRDPAGQEQVGAQAGSVELADVQHRAGLERQRLPAGDPLAVEGRGASAPLTIAVAAWRKRSFGPTRVHSRPAAPSGLPSAQLPRRKERLSIGPEGGTPTGQRPTRPGPSCTVVSIPAASTSMPPGPSALTGG